MDKLPVFLVQSIGNACNIFSNITYTVHGDDTRTRISIMFSSNDSKQTKRRSKSTISRDNKKLNDYIEMMNNIKSQDDRPNAIENSRCQAEILSEGQDDEDNSVEMDIELPNVRSTIMNNNEIKDQNANNCNVKNTIGHENSNEIYEHNLSITNKEKCSQKEMENVNVDESIGKEIELDENETEVDSSMVISKVVLKTSRYSPHKYIGKVHGSNKILMYSVKTQSVEEITETHKYYDTYKKNVEKDFNDVRNNPYRPTYVDRLIDKMSSYAVEHGMYEQIEKA